MPTIITVYIYVYSYHLMRKYLVNLQLQRNPVVAVKVVAMMTTMMRVNNAIVSASNITIPNTFVHRDIINIQHCYSYYQILSNKLFIIIIPVSIV